MKAAIFDFNGTLFDDTRFHVAAWQRFLNEKFSIKLTAERARVECVGPSNTQIFRNFLGDDIASEQMHAWSLEKEEMYREVAREDVENFHLIDGVPEMFDMLTARGIPFALATGSELPNVEFYLEELGMKRWIGMDRIVYYEGSFPGKPDPAIYLEAMRRLNVAPEDCVVCEDTAAGIESARRAGAGRIIAVDTTLSRDELRANSAVYTVIHNYYDFSLPKGRLGRIRRHPSERRRSQSP